MDDLLSWIKNNLKIVIFLSVGVIVFSVFIGLIIGLTSKAKNVYNEKVYQQLKEIELAAKKQEISLKNKKENIFLIPPAADIKMKDIFNYTNTEELTYLLKNLKLRSIKLSDLINERTMGEESNIKPLIINNEEKGIITLKNEIIEP